MNSDHDQTDSPLLNDVFDPGNDSAGTDSQSAKNTSNNNGIGNANSEEQEALGSVKASSSELDQAELQLVNEKLSSVDIAFVIETLKKRAPYDEIPIKQLFYGMSSAFTKLQFHIMLIQKTPELVNHICLVM